MKAIAKKWRKWIALPLAVVLVLGTMLGAQMTRDTTPVAASGVTTSSVTLTGTDPDNNYTYIQFDIGWDFSWRDSVNWDAVWVFAKYLETGGDGAWHHCTLSSTDGDHSVTTNNGVAATIDAASDNTGVFIYRTNQGNGTNDWDGVKLKWQYGTDGLADNDSVTLRVFAIEMVYIPGGVTFYLGDTDDDVTGSFRMKTGGGPVTVNTNLSGLFICGNTSYDDSQLESTGIRVDGDDGLDSNGDGTIDNASFPTGYNAFYCMKYEISQGQYAEFLNTLTQAQQTTHVAADLTDEDDANTYVMYDEGHSTVMCRQAIKAGANPADGDPYSFTCDLDDDDTGNEADDGECIACNYLGWDDGAAYADWAGLRPMTELEFEKICRGDQSVVDDEYAWGSTDLTDAVTSGESLTNPGQASETGANTGDGLCNYDSDLSRDPDGPMRCGFAATGSTTRKGAGASYYGVMEMSGNLLERVVTVGNSAGRCFTGSHGDGALDSSGDANVSNWPGTDAVGSGFRGGVWTSPESYQRVSARHGAASADLYPSSDDGFRLVRTE